MASVQYWVCLLNSCVKAGPWEPEVLSRVDNIQRQSDAVHHGSGDASVMPLLPPGYGIAEQGLCQQAAAAMPNTVFWEERPKVWSWL